MTPPPPPGATARAPAHAAPSRRESLSAAAGTVGTGGPQLPHAPGLDGLRALAVLAVMGYHNGFSWLPGGFYGVDAFFVLSGFLITSLLVVEWHGSDTIRLGRFWARRARRLLPALFVLIAALGVLVLVWPGALRWPDPLGDSTATLFYVANWHFISSGAGYFAASGPPSPLLHTWSLAIEEQFYLVWPLVVLAVVRGFTAAGRRRRARLGHRRRLAALGAVCVIGALASAAYMWHLAPAGGSPDGAYYGTETRAQAVLVGGALAVAFAMFPTASARRRRAGAVLGVVGLLGLAAVWHLVAEGSTLAFHGGFLLASAAAAAVVAGVVLSPAGPAARALALRPVRYVGRISYGVYLWYWPVLLVVTGARTHLSGWPLFACRTGLTVGFAALSYRLVEMPVRHGTLRGWRAAVLAPVAAGLSLALVAGATAPLATGGAGAAALGRTEKASARAVRVLLVGDSMAGSLGAALAPEAPGYRVQLINEGHPGCAVTTDSEYQFLLYRNPPGAPCRKDQPDALLDLWRRYVREYRPDVVVYLARTDLFNQDYDGSWTSVGAPAFDGFLASQLRKGLDVLGAGGARVVLMTSPYYDSTIAGDAPPVPEDAAGRVHLVDRIIGRVAAGHPGTVVFPLGRLADPGGTFTDAVDGVTMRCDDGVHFAVAAGRVIGPRLLPELVRLGRAVKVPPPVHPPAVPAPIPPWYAKLSCG